MAGGSGWSALSFRWSELLGSYGTARWLPRSFNWGRITRWPGSLVNFSIVDDVVWSVVTAVESVALVSTLCFFFLFCGCTV